jgi:hypothetical protein
MLERALMILIGMAPGFVLAVGLVSLRELIDLGAATV